MYRHVDGRLLEYSHLVPDPVKEPGVEELSGPESSWHTQLDDMLERLEMDSVNEQEEVAAPAVSTLPLPQVSILRELAKDIAVPDRYVTHHSPSWSRG